MTPMITPIQMIVLYFSMMQGNAVRIMKHLMNGTQLHKWQSESSSLSHTALGMIGLWAVVGCC